MASGSQRRTRSERVAALELPPGRWERAWASLRRGDVLLRIGLCVAAAVLLCAAIRGWNPPFPYRTGQVLNRDVSARIAFEAVDRVATDMTRERARRQARAVYVLDARPLERLPALLVAAVDGIVTAEGFADVNPEIWRNFQPPDAVSSLAAEESLLRFEKLRQGLAKTRYREELAPAVQRALAPYLESGILLQRPSLGNQAEIDVYNLGHPETTRAAKVADVLAVPGSPLHLALRQELHNDDVADPVFDWIRHRLAVVRPLSLDETETRKALAAAEDLKDVVINYTAGQTLAVAGQPLSASRVALLRLEHEAVAAQRPLRERIARAAAVVAVVLALMAFCGVHLYRHASQIAVNLRRLGMVLALLVATVALSAWVASNEWRAELIPFLLFGQVLAIAYRQDVALLLAGAAALVLAMGIGQGLAGFLLMAGALAAVVLQLGSIRTRSKLIHVGLFGGVAAVLLTLALAMLHNQPIDRSLLVAAGCNGLWTLAAGFLMTGLLPFVEHWFGVLTDLSLLELADVSHPLLQELVRRAPSTYNHSITVGSIAEAAAEAIGARGLLVRVGAYYHDIGKMLKPGYFIENQPRDGNGNRHESLNPAMSTLVIIAHIKDGGNLARQHGLPQPIIDFIEQHHGTTLVEYFYGRATEQQQANPNGGEVDENLYRYPGPKPQTKEAAVMMLADAVESASRSLVDPAPSRIESLVREIAERKLDDGQFDESGLTLRELRTIENSMIKSLIAIYHGRVKYPEPKTA